MPRPPILPIPSWEEIFEQADTFDDWLKKGEVPEHQAGMREDSENLSVPESCLAVVKSLARGVNVLIFAEDWCPDVVRHVPVLEAIRREQPSINTRYLMRADHSELYERYLTFGGEGVPKFVFFNQDWVECGEWGPMPEDCKAWIARGRACGDQYAARVRVFHLYLQDPDRVQVFDDLTRWVEITSTEVIDTKGLIV